MKYSFQQENYHPEVLEYNLLKHILIPQRMWRNLSLTGCTNQKTFFPSQTFESHNRKEVNQEEKYRSKVSKKTTENVHPKDKQD